ncbi:preprotein translocase subunit YajC [Dethiosulfovibrio salsuginis]|uniref:Preprotein translocase subunit YajC n=1 Tax=Dethiosulfovibrio salsuginis TaxID=561720 RepID=A0A1X7JB66_9BACT|nr:preprotein translocase subunit YajC [Dethiosulfovibrio salsuginis]SMG24607.1 preprotein translocase subunit YajC [Dethiosulfovibrio salsuginis]
MNQSGQAGAMQMFFPLVIFVVIFYFFIIRPQKKRQKKHDDLIGSLGRGDRVITAGGFIGIVREVKDDSFILEISEGVKVRVLKGSVSSKMAVETGESQKTSKDETKSDSDSGKVGLSKETPEDSK